jgi:hypothetical protein
MDWNIGATLHIVKKKIMFVVLLHTVIAMLDSLLGYTKSYKWLYGLDKASQRNENGAIPYRNR